MNTVTLVSKQILDVSSRKTYSWDSVGFCSAAYDDPNLTNNWSKKTCWERVKLFPVRLTTSVNTVLVNLIRSAILSHVS